MARGRPRKPTNLKVLHGTDRADRTNPNEPTCSGPLGDPPAHLSDVALAKWREIVPWLEQNGLVGTVDRGMIEGLCVCYARAVAADAEVAAKGMVSDGRKRPEVNISRESWTEYRRFCTEYGLSAASRGKVSAVPRGDKDKDETAKFFGSKKTG